MDRMGNADEVRRCIIRLVEMIQEEGKLRKIYRLINQIFCRG